MQRITKKYRPLPRYLKLKSDSVKIRVFWSENFNAVRENKISRFSLELKGDSNLSTL